MLETVTIDRLVHGGQGIATMADGQKVFVWNALPGETVAIRIIKKKRSYAEAIAEEIIKPSPDRIEAKEPNYLATSPWQVMTYEAENKAKRTIIEDLFAHEKVELPDFGDVISVEPEWHYRNKMEYSFWGDDDGLHLALHRRGSHGKEIVDGSQLAMPAVDAAANAILAQLQNRTNIRAGDLKTLIIRASQSGEAVASLFVKPKKFPKVNLPDEVKGLQIWHSNPRSPASVATELISEQGSIMLTDELLGQPFRYDVNSFFQVNIPIFEQTLQKIKDVIKSPHVTDMFGGVGSIGLTVAQGSVNIIELDVATALMANVNAEARRDLNVQVTQAPAEKTLDFITADAPVIFDPPRAGLHEKVVEKVLEKKPPQIVYLSCNPATQARDLARLQGAYTIESFDVFNYFPRTPHIETLAVLVLK